MIDRILAWFNIFPTFGGVSRSSRWGYVRQGYIALYPTCAVCGTKKDIEIHHQRPYHLHPELELDSKNLISLCRRDHLLFGHLGNFKSFDAEIKVNARIMNDRIKSRP